MSSLVVISFKSTSCTQQLKEWWGLGEELWGEGREGAANMKSTNRPSVLVQTCQFGLDWQTTEHI